MPFPLAHPAAVLPLKRFCPRQFSFAGLVVGSLSPDVAYLFGKLDWDEISHGTLGLIVFCLPVGPLLLALLCSLRPRLITVLPESYRPAFIPERWRPAGSWATVVASLLVGAATHLIWDSFTHTGGWTVDHVPCLATVLASFGGHKVRLCRLLWYASSFAGVAAVSLAYTHAQARLGKQLGLSGARRFEAVAIAAVVLPIELVHELVPGVVGGAIVAMLSFLLVGAVIWKNQARASRRLAARAGI